MHAAAAAAVSRLHWSEPLGLIPGLKGKNIYIKEWRLEPAVADNTVNSFFTGRAIYKLRQVPIGCLLYTSPSPRD